MRKVVLANGCFDPFHWGHLKHLQAARLMGDELVVSVTRDRSVNKGPHRPAVPEDRRAEVIAALKVVSRVILVDSSLEALEIVQPDVFVKGGEYQESILLHDRAYCAKHGIEIRFTNEPRCSSTDLLHHYDRLRQD